MRHSQDSTWNRLIEYSLTATKAKCFKVSLKFEVEGKTWNAYEVTVSNRDILFFCKQGTVTYLVDSYGTRNVAELFDWEEDC